MGSGAIRTRGFAFSAATGPGGHAARNAGIAVATAPLIAFLDADDAWEPIILETILRLRAAYPQAGAYATAYRIQDRDGQVRLKDYEGVPSATWEGLIPDYFASVARSNLLWTSVVAIPKAVFAAVGGARKARPGAATLTCGFESPSATQSR